MARKSDEAAATAVDFASLILRLPLGVLLAWSGVERLISMPSGSDWSIPSATMLTDQAATIVLQGLPYVELVAGLLLGLGFIGRLGSFLAICGLFSLCLLYGWGDQTAPFSPRLIYLSVAAGTLLLGSGMLSADFIVFGSRRDRR
jgi:uncharacterized membrane protein YphA (DoxX/SURF4 family)